MRILFLALGDRNVASSRIRAWNLSEHLSRAGHSARTLRGSSISTLKTILLTHRWDVIVIQKWAPPLWMTLLIRWRAKKLIYDCDDAVYMTDEAKARVNTSDSAEKHRRRAQRLALRLPRVLRLSHGFTSSTDIILSDLQDMVPKPGLVFPGPMPDREPQTTERATRTGVVWLGSPATERYLERLAPELSALQGELSFTAMGASEKSEDLGIRTAKWSESNEAELLQTALMGLFIQPSGDWEERKSGYKILEYVSSGVIPVVERNDQATSLLPAEYAFYFEPNATPREIVDVFHRVASFPRLEIEELASSLLKDTRARFSYDAIVARWLRFVSSINPSERSVSL